MAENINSTVSYSTSVRNHELTMLYLKQQDLSKLSVPEIAKKYSSIKLVKKIKHLLFQVSVLFF